MFRVLRNVCAAVLLVFLCTIPVFYGLTAAGLPAGGIYAPYIIARLLRFPLMILPIGLVARARNRDLLAQADGQKDRGVIFTLTCVCIGIAVFLHVSGTSQHIYGVISGMLWIYHPDKTPLPLAVVWEQLFSGDLYWILLLCLAVVFRPQLSAVRVRRSSPGV